MENLKKEIGFMMCINHENIVKLYEVLASKTKIYLILEYLSGGDLYENIRMIFN
jgi:pentatricopeptide repeat domain-containing protein 1